MHHHQTLISPVEFTGIGVHSGLPVRLSVTPKTTPGITFYRTDLGMTSVEVSPRAVVQAERATLLKKGDATIMTPEHFLAACVGLGLTALHVKLDQAELPILDGSAWPFVVGLKAGGVRVLADKIVPLQLDAPIVVRDQETHIAAFPDTTFRLTHIAHYGESYIGTQAFSIDMGKSGRFEAEVAPARTHGRLSDLAPLQQKGLAKGSGYDNTLALGKAGYLNTPRFADEIARHKILDMIGDLAILNRPLLAHVVGYQCGHKLNQALVSALSKA